MRMRLAWEPKDKDKAMNKRLYVGGLSYNTNEDMLTELFAAAGEVQSAEVIRDRHSGYSRGFAFVEMQTEEDAQKAVEQFNGTELDGREIRVAEAKPRRESSSSRDRWSSW